MSTICKLCGAGNDANATVCKYCKTPLPVATPPITQNNFPQPPQNQPSWSQPYQAETYSSQPAAEKSYDIFSDDSWTKLWECAHDNDHEIGIILTNTSEAPNTEDFKKALNDYIEYKRSVGVGYSILDVNTQKVMNLGKNLTCEDIVDLLIEVYNVEVPDYLMIVGDDTVIPRIKWDNESPDDDENVPSDLPYITLNTDSPWRGVEYDFCDITKVGRIPADATTNFKNAIAYFENTAKARTYEKANSFAYSAEVWEKTSSEEFAPIRPAFLTSPPYTIRKDLVENYSCRPMGRIGTTYNLLCFNLHGSDATHYWYGQAEGSGCIEAFAPILLPSGSENGYVVCTEACYGARPNVVADGQDSFVLSALSDHALAFVGSTRIAYGLCSGGLSCADIVIGEFSSAVANGETFGEAFLQALDELYDARDMNEISIKTLAEFALYGDPSCSLVKRSAKKNFGTRNLSISNTKANSLRAISLYSCNGNGHGGFALYGMKPQEAAKIQLMSKKVSETGKQYILSNFSNVSAEMPSIYKVAGARGYRAVYSNKIGNIKSFIQLHLDDDGNVEKTYISK